jgi:hypothetical protein
MRSGPTVLSDTPVFDETCNALNLNPKLLCAMIRQSVVMAKMMFKLKQIGVL